MEKKELNLSSIFRSGKLKEIIFELIAYTVKVEDKLVSDIQLLTIINYRMKINKQPVNAALHKSFYKYLRRLEKQGYIKIKYSILKVPMQVNSNTLVEEQLQTISLTEKAEKFIGENYILMKR